MKKTIKKSVKKVVKRVVDKKSTLKQEELLELEVFSAILKYLSTLPIDSQTIELCSMGIFFTALADKLTLAPTVAMTELITQYLQSLVDARKKSVKQ